MPPEPHQRPEPPHEQARYWRLPQCGNLELLHACFHKHTFNRHFHEGYAFGVIEAGALGFHYMGRETVAAAGEINLAIPGEPHNGFAAGREGWQYRMFYVDADLVGRSAGEISGKTGVMPFFKTGVIRDHQLAVAMLALHRRFSQGSVSPLEAESRFLEVLAKLVLQHAEGCAPIEEMKTGKRAVTRGREYIRAHFDENITLEALSREAGMSRFHLLRVFHREIGLPPHAYQNLLRVATAKRLLSDGHPIGDVAAKVGLYDQSHLNRLFKKTYGVTPGQFSNSVQDK